jgi:hypothetical protein
MTLPTSVEYGSVKWKAVSAAADGADGDAYPDAVPVTGAVTFKPRVSGPLLSPGSTPPVSVFPIPVTYTLDSDGILRDASGSDTIYLIATDSAGLNPVDWTWQASYNLNDGLVMGSFDFELPAGGNIDLTTVTPVSTSTGTPIVTGPTGPAGAPGTSATIAVGTVTTGAAGSSASVTNSGSSSAAVFNFTIPRGATGTGVPTGGATGQVVSYNGTATFWADSATIATVSTFMKRDAAGRAQVAAPSAAADIARLDTVQNHANLNTANFQTGTTYTFVALDQFRQSDFSNAGAITATIPLNSSVPFPVGTILVGRQFGAGQLSFVGAGGVTVNVPTGRSAATRAQWSIIYAVKRDTDHWTLIGDLAWSSFSASEIEIVQDAVGALFADSGQYDWTYNDAGNAVALAILSASATAQGIVELATPAEAITGTDTARAVTPEGLWAALGTVTVNQQTGTTYTAVLTDQGKLVEFTNASAVTFTIPPNSSVAFPVGAQIFWRAYGAGTVTFTQGAGVTIRARGSATKSAGTYAEGVLTKRATDEWVNSGDIIP